MTSYEALIAFHPKTEEEKLEAILKKYEDRLKAAGAETLKIEKWGRKQLPFTLKNHKDAKDANFVLISFEGESKLPKVLTDGIRITEEVVRFLITKAGPKKVIETEDKPEVEKTEISSSVLLDVEGKPGA